MVSVVVSVVVSVAGRVGEHSARIILASIWPWSAGIRKRPWQVPSSSSRIVNVVRRNASASSASKALPSNASARSGAITSRIRPPRMRSAFASWSSASPTRCVSAVACWSAVTANRPVRGSRSSEATIARAWARLTRPAAIASARTWWSSSRRASLRSERASRRTCRVSTEIQSAAEPAPAWMVASQRSASASRRSLRASSCASAFARVARVVRCCSGGIDQSGTSATASSLSLSRWAKSATGWRWWTGWLLMSEFKHRALTEKGL